VRFHPAAIMTGKERFPSPKSKGNFQYWGRVKAINIFSQNSSITVEQWLDSPLCPECQNQSPVMESVIGY
jgi:hypothetical protein